MPSVELHHALERSAGRLRRVGDRRGKRRGRFRCGRNGVNGLRAQGQRERRYCGERQEAR
jgi:hypothetical protein